MGTPVLLYIPNLVGYARVVATMFAFSYAFTDAATCGFFYLLGQGLDAVDGTAARYFGQCSKFGAVLDMLTDRMSTAVLLIVLSHLYPHAWGFFAFLVVLDIVSHWFQMYSKSIKGASSHKGSKNPMLDFYYNFPYALLVFCVGNEFFLVCLYLLSFATETTESVAMLPVGVIKLIAYVCFPIFFGKQFMNFVQLYDSVMEVVALDQKK